MRGLGKVIAGPTGKKAIAIPCSRCGCDEAHLEILPASLQDIPEGFIAFLDLSGKLSFVEEDPHDYR